MPLAEEIRLLERAGFAVDVPWRRSPFAVIVGYRHAQNLLWKRVRICANKVSHAFA